MDKYYYAMKLVSTSAMGLIALPLFFWWFPDFLRWFGEKSVGAMSIAPKLVGVIPLCVFMAGFVFCIFLIMGINPLLSPEDEDIETA